MVVKREDGTGDLSVELVGGGVLELIEKFVSSHPLLQHVLARST
jgi:hypothetical protein